MRTIKSFLSVIQHYKKAPSPLPIWVLRYFRKIWDRNLMYAGRHMPVQKFVRQCRTVQWTRCSIKGTFKSALVAVYFLLYNILYRRIFPYKGGRANFFLKSTIDENPKILRLILLPQFRSFLRCASPQIADTQFFMGNPKIANPQISLVLQSAYLLKLLTTFECLVFTVFLCVSLYNILYYANIFELYGNVYTRATYNRFTLSGKVHVFSSIWCIHFCSIIHIFS